jgi:hypothetical protein
MKENNMRNKKEFVGLTDKIHKNGQNIIEANDEYILSIIKSEIKRLGYAANLNHIDVSGVTQMSKLFASKEYKARRDADDFFTGDMSQWSAINSSSKSTISQWTKANNLNLNKSSNWNVGHIESMDGIFKGWHNEAGLADVDVGEFNGDISEWKVFNVKNAKSMFAGSKFNNDLNDWIFAKGADVNNIFQDSNFEKDISSWPISEYSNFNGSSKSLYERSVLIKNINLTKEKISTKSL